MKELKKPAETIQRSHWSREDGEQLMRNFERVARRSGFGSVEHCLQQFKNLKGFTSTTELRTELVHQLEKRSLSPDQTERWSDDQWLRFVSQESLSRTTKHRKLSRLISTRLEELNKSQSWLARQLGVSREAVRQYIAGTASPKKERMALLEAILNIKVNK